MDAELQNLQQFLQQLAEHHNGQTTLPSLTSLSCPMLLLSGDLITLSMLIDCSNSQWSQLGWPWYERDTKVREEVTVSVRQGFLRGVQLRGHLRLRCPLVLPEVQLGIKWQRRWKIVIVEFQYVWESCPDSVADSTIADGSQYMNSITFREVVASKHTLSSLIKWFSSGIVGFSQ